METQHPYNTTVISDNQSASSVSDKPEIKVVDKRLLAYKKILEGSLIICAGIYELVTGERPPSHRDVLSM